jgi:hypothetical protein
MAHIELGGIKDRVGGAARGLADRMPRRHAAAAVEPEDSQLVVVKRRTRTTDTTVVPSWAKNMLPQTDSMSIAPSTDKSAATKAPIKKKSPDTTPASKPATQPAKPDTKKARPTTTNKSVDNDSVVIGTTRIDTYRSGNTVRRRNSNHHVNWTAVSGLAIAGAVGLLALRTGNNTGVASATNTEGPTGSPTAEPTPTSTATTTATVAPTPKSSDVLTNPNKETFPTTREAVVAALGGNINPDFVMRGYNDDGTANGSWNVEAFPLLDGVTANSNGDYVDANGDVLTNQRKVFNFAAKPQWLNKLTLTIPHAYMFARTGGDTPSGEGNQANISRFDGTMSSTINAPIEQAALIPTADCDPATAAWRDGVSNAAWNNDVQKGTVHVEWFNPKTQQLELLDLKTMSALAKGGRNMDFIQELPAGTPLTPKEIATAVGAPSTERNWYFDPKSVTWTYEGFGLLSGVKFDGAVFRNNRGDVLTDQSKIFNFHDYNPDTWAKSMGMGDLGNIGRLFVRAGGDGEPTNSSYYLFGNAETPKGKYEQATLIIKKTPATAGCVSVEAEAKADSQADAQNNADSNNGTTTWLWNQDTNSWDALN